MTEKRGFLGSIIGFSVSSWIGFILGIISVPVLTSLLKPSQYAIINQFNAASLFFMSLFTIGMDSGFVRFFFEPPSGFRREQVLGNSLYYSTAILIVFSLICIPFYSELSGLLFGIKSWQICLLFFFAVLSQIFIRFFTTNYRLLNSILAFTIISIALQLITKFSLLIALPFHGSDFSLLFAFTLGIFLLAGVTFIVNFSSRSFSWSSVPLIKNREFMKYSLGSWLVPMVIYANTYFSQIIIRHFAGENTLGIYLSANVFAGILGVVQYGFTNYWSAYMFENYNKNQDLIKKVHDYICFFSVAAMCAFIFAKDFLYLFIGSQYHASKSIFALVISAPLFTLIGETTAYGISIEKKAHVSLYSYIVFFFLNMILSFILVPLYGMFGAALSLMISGLVNLIVQTFFGQKYYVTIENKFRTFLTISAILSLSFLNYFFDEKLLPTIILTSGILIFIIVLYFKSLRSGIYLFRRSNQI